jgi:hypothetical protein
LLTYEIMHWQAGHRRPAVHNLAVKHLRLERTLAIGPVIQTPIFTLADNEDGMVLHI